MVTADRPGVQPFAESLSGAPARKAHAEPLVHPRVARRSRRQRGPSATGDVAIERRPTWPASTMSTTGIVKAPTSV
jgi:hypothetical protein